MDERGAGELDELEDCNQKCYIKIFIFNKRKIEKTKQAKQANRNQHGPYWIISSAQEDFS